MAFSNPQYLVSTDWLAEHLDDPAVRVLDVTAKLTSSLENVAEADHFAPAHIPGSVFFDVSSGKGVLSDPDAALPWTWPSPDRVAASLAAAGVSEGDRVILVGRTPRPGIDAGTMWCTRAWWTLHHSGVDCAILQGGLERWEAEGRPVASSPDRRPEAEPAPAIPSPGWVVDGRSSALATKADVVAAVEGIAQDGPAAPVCLVDALTEDSFDGTGTAYGPRSGHITGAINVPFRSLIETETAGFVDAEAMRAHLTETGLLGDRPVITYCGGAIAATVDAFALALFAKTDVSVYDGSLMEWTVDSDLPMTDPSG